MYLGAVYSTLHDFGGATGNRLLERSTSDQGDGSCLRALDSTTTSVLAMLCPRAHSRVAMRCSYRTTGHACSGLRRPTNQTAVNGELSMQQHQASADPPSQSSAKLGSSVRIFSRPSSTNIEVQDQQRDSGKDSEPFLGVLGSPQVSPRLYLTVAQIGGIGRCARIRLAWLALHTVAAEMSREGGQPTESSSCEYQETEQVDAEDNEACK